MSHLRWLMLGASLVFSGAQAVAADSMTLLNPPNNGDAAGGVYTSPYNIGVNGTTLQLICDDFTTDIYVGEVWTASATTLTQINSADIMNLKFGNPAAEPAGTSLLFANTVEDYGIAAVLAAELLNTQGLTADQIAGYSFAIWDVFDSTLVGSSCCGSDPYGSLTSAQWTDAYNYLNAAESVAGAALVAGNGSVNLNQISINGRPIDSFTVYTPIVPPGPNAQEFLQVTMPESSSLGMLGIDLLAVMGLIALFRKHVTRIVS